MLKAGKKVADKNIIDNKNNLVLCFMVLVLIFYHYLIKFYLINFNLSKDQ